MSYPAVASLLPHAGSAVLIDEILRDDDNFIDVAVKITPGHPFFVPNRGVPVWVGIEMMAQAVAAHSGLIGQRRGEAPRSGMLLGTRRYQGHAAWFTPDQTLTVHAQAAFGHHGGGMAACDCRIDCDDTILAEATIIIMELTTD